MKTKKQKEKHGKSKKHEKHKKAKKSKKSSSSSSTSSGSEDETLMTEWVEATQPSKPTGEKVETKRDDWMQDECFVPTYSKDVSQSKKMKRKVRSEEEIQKEKKILEQRELNPYWKGEGTGLPTSSSTVTQTVQSSSSIGDGGYHWLRKAYQRVLEKAEEEGRSLEEVAAERWGSLARLESMLEDAEKRANPRIQTEKKSSTLDRFRPKQFDNEDHSGSSREKYKTSHHHSGNDSSPIHLRDRDSKISDRTKKRRDSFDDSNDNHSHRVRSSSTRSRDRDAQKSDRSKRHQDSSDDSDHRRTHKSQSSSTHSRDRDRSRSDRGKRYNNSSDDSDEKRSHKFRSHHESQSKDKSHSRNHKLNYHSSKYKKSHSDRYEKDAWHRDSRSSSPPKHGTDEEPEDKKRSRECDSRSDSRCHPDEVYAWSRRAGDQDSSRRDSSSMQRMSEQRRDKETNNERRSTHQPSWKKKLSEKDSGLGSKFLQSGDISPFKCEPTDSYKDPVPSSSGISMKDLPHDSEKCATASSAESSDDEDETKKETQKLQAVVLNDNELNYLAARLLRANLWGDSKLASRIERDLEKAKKRQAEFKESGEQLPGDFPRKMVLDSVVDCYPLPKGFKVASGKKGSKGKTVYLGQTRTKYFDDEKMSLQHIFEREKSTSVDDHLKMFVDAASSRRGVMDEECDEDVSGKTAAKMNKRPDQEKDIQKSIRDYKHLSFALDRCRFCINKPGLLKHTIVGKVNEVFLCCPSFKSLAEGHSFIVPVTHVSSTLLLEENEYAEVQAFKRGLMKMFGDRGKGMIFMETSIKQRFFPHAVIECIPVPKDTWDMAPLYFKKAIEESEYEWSHNKKLIDLSKKGVRNSVPKGLPFFSVEFGNTGGFAHIIEDDNNFPRHFGREIVGGMLEMDSHEIKEKDESFDDICEKVMKIVNIWWEYEEYFKH